jgi:pentatricopeptide repeat protein
MDTIKIMKVQKENKKPNPFLMKIIQRIIHHPTIFPEILYDIEVSGKTYIVKWFSRQKMHDLAITIFEAYQPQDTKFHNVGLAAYGHAGKVNCMLDLFKKYSSLADHVTYSTMISFLGKYKRSNLAETIFRSIETANMDVVICTSMMFTLIRNKLYSEAEDLFASMHQTFLFKDIFGQITVDPVDTTIQELEELGFIMTTKYTNVATIQPNKVCFVALFTVYANTGAWKKSLLLLHHLLSCGETVDDQILDLIECSHGGQNHFASSVVNMLLSCT